MSEQTLTMSGRISLVTVLMCKENIWPSINSTEDFNTFFTIMSKNAMEILPHTDTDAVVQTKIYIKCEHTLFLTPV